MEIAIKAVSHVYTYTQMHIDIHQSVIRLQPVTGGVNAILA